MKNTINFVSNGTYLIKSNQPYAGRERAYISKYSSFDGNNIFSYDVRNAAVFKKVEDAVKYADAMKTLGMIREYVIIEMAERYVEL